MEYYLPVEVLLIFAVPTLRAITKAVFDSSYRLFSTAITLLFVDLVYEWRPARHAQGEEA